VNRIGRNKNVIIVINGATGSGKTYAAIDVAIKVAAALKTNFSIKTNMDFDFKNFIRKTMLPENEKPGTCFVFEEVGASGGGGMGREFLTKVNRLFFSFMQTTRHRRQVLIFTCPSFKFLDFGTRQLVHLQISMSSINERAKQSVGDMYLLQTNAQTSKIYFKRMRVKTGLGTIKYRKHRFNLPPKNVLEEYECLKTKFTTQMNKGITEEAYKPAPRYNEDEIWKLYQSGEKQINIARKLKAPYMRIYRIIQKLEKKNKEVSKNNLFLQQKTPLSSEN
jgi:hypothetical protein